MKYLVVDDTGKDVFIEEFETLSEANWNAWHTYKRYQTYPIGSSKRKHHIYVATPAEDGDMNTKDNYFDSYTFYIPNEESFFDNLVGNIHDIYVEEGSLDFVLDDGKFVFSVPLDLIEDFYGKAFYQYDNVGKQIIYKHYREAVQEKIDEVLSFYELD